MPKPQIPALATRMSRRPSSSTATDTARSIWSVSLTSAGTPMQRPPSCSTSRTVSSRSARAGQGIRHGRRTLAVADVADDDVRPFGGQRQGMGSPLPSGGASDQRRTAGQFAGWCRSGVGLSVHGLSRSGRSRRSFSGLPPAGRRLARTTPRSTRTPGRTRTPPRVRTSLTARTAGRRKGSPTPGSPSKYAVNRLTESKWRAPAGGRRVGPSGSSGRAVEGRSRT